MADEGPRQGVLLVNPTAGRGRSAAVHERVYDALIALGWEVRHVVARDEDHAVEVAAKTSPDEVVVSLGGDGMHGIVTRGCLASGAVLAPLPGGRGNDFVKAVGLPVDPVAAVQRLANARVRRLDVAEVNGVPYLGVATMGYESLSNEISNNTRWLRGPAVYTYGGILAIVKGHAHEYHLAIDGETQVVRGRSLAIGMSGRYAGGLRICPDAIMDDGLLDLTLIGDMPRHTFVGVLTKIPRATHIYDPRITTARGHEFTITADEPLDIYADGSLLGTTPATIRVRERALRILA